MVELEKAKAIAEKIKAVLEPTCERIEMGERFPSGHILRKLAEPLGFSEIELLKLAGFISPDESDDRLNKFKEEIKREIADILVSLHKKIDSL